jgi:hypothetical protein
MDSAWLTVTVYSRVNPSPIYQAVACNGLVGGL